MTNSDKGDIDGSAHHNEEQLQCKEKSEAANMRLQSYQFFATMYSLPIVDVILGLPWLESLGPVLTDYKSRIMKFERENKEIILKGHANKEIVLVDMRSVMMDWGLEVSYLFWLKQ